MIYSSELISGKWNSFLGLGTWRFGELENPGAVDDPMRCYWGGQKRQESVRTLHAAIRNGITHFDTAQAYGGGKSEQLVGQELRKIREKIIIADKFVPFVTDFHNTEKKVELSLRRLNSEYIDIMYIHWPVSGNENARVVENLEKLKEAGKIRHIGVSNMNCSEISEAARGGKIDFCQVGYNIFWRHCEKDIIPFCRKNGIFLVAYGIFGQGIFSGRQGIGKSLAVPEDERKKLIFLGNEYQDYNSLYSMLLDVSRESGIKVPGLILGWLKKKAIFATVLSGASMRNQIDENCSVLENKISDEILCRLEKISDLSLELSSGFGNIFNHRM